jgi:hypothetical protein
MKDVPIRGHRVASTAASEGKAHRFADRARPCALIDVRMSRRAPAIDEEGYWISSSTASDASPFAPCGAVGRGGLTTTSLALPAVSANDCGRTQLRADPNTLEMLFLPSARPCDPIGEWLIVRISSAVSST